MEASIQEWLNIVARWIHVIAAIMWVGDSFLFMWMDSHLSKPRKPGDDALAGELWMVHSGGFYEVYKRKYLRPDQLPPKLYWFKWESYTTWISGMCLLVIVYFMGGAVYLIDPSVMPMSQFAAVHLTLGLLAVGWLVYDALCTFVFRGSIRRAAAIGWPLIVALAYGLGQVYAPRAAFLLVGAIMGTIMAGNVFFRIIPAQRHMLAATKAGTPVDTSYGLRAKQRSMHNHYMTLPVIFTMLSNHFPGMYGHPQAWVILALLFAFGVSLKIFMNQRGETPLPILALGGIGLAGVVAMTFPKSAGSSFGAYADHPPVPFARVQEIVSARCVSCHSENPATPAFPVAPNGVKFDTPALVHAYAERMYVRAVVNKTMPLANMTGMTDVERAEFGAWVAQGANIEGATGVIGGAAPGALSLPGPTLAVGISPVAEARTIYASRCALCHGPGGAGDGPTASVLRPHPRDYRDAAWQKGVTDEALGMVIVQGGAAAGLSTAMPPNPELATKPEVVAELVGLIRGFGGKK